MKRTKRLKLPATFFGFIVGAVIGIIFTFKDTTSQESPTLGVIILIAMPALSFLFEMLTRVYSPTFYRKRIAGSLYFLWRWTFNSRFYLKFNYQLDFPGAREMAVSTVCDILGAGPGKDPESQSLGENYVHLQYSNISHYIVVEWNSLPMGSEDGTDKKNELEKLGYTVTLKPAVRELGMRNASKELELLANRIDAIRDSLISNIPPLPNGHEMSEMATVTAGLLADILKSENSGVQYEKEFDSSSKANVKYSRHWVQLTGKKSSVLTAIYRWLKVLEN